MASTVLVNTAPLRRLQTMLQLSASNAPEVVVMYKRWAFFYRSFAQLRYNRASRGNGTWAPLKKQRTRDKAAANRKARKDPKYKRRGASILLDTATLVTVLDPSGMKPGGYELRNAEGLLVGYGGTELHPTSETVTIHDIAVFHQVGAGNLPVREIVVPPDDATLRQMTRETLRTAQAIIDRESTI